MAKYLVLGGCGFIGSKIVSKLAQNEKNEIVVGDLVANEKFAKYKNVSFTKIDFVNKRDFDKELEGVDVVYHLISTITPSDDTSHIWDELEANVRPTICLLDSMVKCKNIKLIFVSSGGTVYGNVSPNPISETEALNPVCNYGVSKEIIEKYMYLYHHMHGLDYRIIRLANPYGTKVKKNQKQGLIPIFIDRIINDEPVVVFGNGEKIRDYIHIDDAVAAVFAVESYVGEHKIFNVGTAEGYSILQILDLIVKELKCEYPQIEFIPDRKCDVDYNVLDNSAIIEKTDWKPTIMLEQGIHMMIQNMNNEG